MKRNPLGQVARDAVRSLFDVVNAPSFDLLLAILKRQEAIFTAALGSNASIK